MKIEKFKKNKNGSYTLLLENGEILTAYEEVILNYNLLLSREIKDQNRQAILQENAFWETYYQGLKMIKVKARAKKELEEDLKKKGYQKENIDRTIQKLEEQKYLNDQRYADSYVNKQILTTSWGPLKIKNALLQKGIEVIFIQEALEQYQEHIEKEKLAKLVARKIRSNQNKSTSFLKQNIMQSCLKDGYHIELIQQALQEASFQGEKELREKEYYKLKQRLSRKYSGEELEQQIRIRLYKKGFTNDL